MKLHRNGDLKKRHGFGVHAARTVAILACFMFIVQSQPRADAGGQGFAAHAQPVASVGGSIVSIIAPDSMRPGETAQVKVTVKNTESARWRLGSGSVDFRLGSGSLDFRLGSGSVDFCCIWGYGRTQSGTGGVTLLGAKKLPRELAGGEEYTFTVPFTVPAGRQAGEDLYLRIFFQKDGRPEFGSGYKKIIVRSGVW